VTSAYDGAGLTVSTSGDTDIVLTRIFAAPAHLVFAALTQPALLRRWHGARGWSLVVCEIDLRVGGLWRFVSRGPDGAEMEMHGAYHEIVEPTRLVHSEIHSDWPAGDSLVITDLAETDGATAMTATVTYTSSEIRDQVLRSPMQRGLGEAYDRLTAVFSKLVAHPPITGASRE
jgi:uncharacterized protein YndB with AHSA1/START domain